jgi:hypothetical protein
VGGLLPLVLAVFLWKVLPESPRYLARDRSRWPELAALLKRIGHDVPADATFVDSHEKAAAKATVGSLLVPEYRRDTIALCFAFCDAQRGARRARLGARPHPAAAVEAADALAGVSSAHLTRSATGWGESRHRDATILSFCIPAVVCAM